MLVTLPALWGRHGGYSATRRPVSDQAHASTPFAVAELPAGWPQRGKVEFNRFILSDCKLRILGRAIQVPDGSAYQYAPPGSTSSSLPTNTAC